MVLGGKVVTDPTLSEGATEIACPDKATEVLAKHAAASAEGGE